MEEFSAAASPPPHPLPHRNRSEGINDTSARPQTAVSSDPFAFHSICEAPGRELGGTWEAPGRHWRPGRHLGGGMRGQRRLGGKVRSNHCVLRRLSMRPPVSRRRDERGCHRLTACATNMAARSPEILGIGSLTPYQHRQDPYSCKLFGESYKNSIINNTFWSMWVCLCAIA